ncbi:MAG: Holliday junction resolvase RuvX, partial [Gammaproteobacteria bacterium]
RGGMKVTSAGGLVNCAPMHKSEGVGETVLGFDYGTQRIGVAVGETVTGSARALTALHTGSEAKPPWPEIEDLLATWRPARLVVGLPQHLDGRESPLGAAARTFAAELGQRSKRPVSLWNEALSTEAARETLADRRRAGARRADRDRLNAQAACEILQGWLAENAHG